MNEGLNSLVALALLGLTTGFSCSAQLITGGCCLVFPSETDLYHSRVMDGTDLCYLSRNVLWILLVLATRVDAF